MRLKKLVVKNFKSLRDCEIELNKFNVLIGPNASGKTNLVEVFKLLRKIYLERDDNPFLEWWGYNNVVWAGKEELPITVGMLFDVDGYDVYFETTFTGTGGSFRILKEVLEVKGYLTLEKKGPSVHLKYSERFYWATKEVPGLINNLFIPPEPELMLEAPGSSSLLGLLSPEKPEEAFFSEVLGKLFGALPLIKTRYASKKEIFVVSPKIGEDLVISRFVKGFLLLVSSPLLRQLNIRSAKNPQYPRKETTLKEDASNLIPLLYNLWLREGRLPDEISKPLSIAFPNTRVFFQLTEDGRVMMKVFENDLELAPPSISDGFYKVLAILTAAYLKPPLLIIDEIENSLHPETLELIIDTLKESESQVIITTHSPVVVDIVEPSDLVLVDKEEGETIFRRIRNPEKIKKFLNEKGITLSEGWLYGSLFENDEQ
ncbi:AAA family ATPase [Thermococcus sp. AM4]|uniref:AAA family ATPase n=1 Tax=Thermococcus sp. (strain AM4) TaxID=246969 RepID=UPI0001871029|nr:AAA family ATPase [Thermococcus sp. AM4]EEB73911.1 RecF/RecN/SMC N terminal domain, putative [Thermococcus sp. AM4]